MQSQYNLKDLQLKEVKDVFHTMPFFMAKWKTIKYHYHVGLIYNGDGDLKPEQYNPRYTGELKHSIPLELQEQYSKKPLRIFYERIYCAGNNGCTVIPESDRINKKISK